MPRTVWKADKKDKYTEETQGGNCGPSYVTSPTLFFFFFFSLIKQLQKMHQKQFVNELKTEACSLALIKSSGSPHSSLKAFDG